MKAALIFTFGLLSFVMIADVLADEPNRTDSYYALIYDFEVAQFCGLVNKPTHDAFWAKRKAIEEKSQRTTEQLRKTRIGAMAAADIEYANRGLGGYKPWCQNEGRAGVERITSP